MKTTCFALSLLPLLVAHAATAQETDWIWQNPLPQGNTLHAVHFLDALQGWAVGEAGTIVHTSDGGATWAVQNSSTGLDLSDVHFVDALQGWAVGADNFSALILHTSDGGASWQEQYALPSGILYTLHFVDARTGWAVGNELLLRTTDGGATWMEGETTTDAGTSLRQDVFFTDAQTGWIVGISGLILHTTDGGATWTKQESGLGPTPNPFNAVHFVDGQVGWIVGNSVVLHTRDGGESWVEQEADRGRFTGVHFVDVDHGWISTNQRTFEGTSIRVTTDGGATWTSVATGAGFDLMGVHFADENTGWLVGMFGEILRTDDGGQSWGVQTSGTHDDFWGVTFVNADTGLAVGPRDFAYLTDDGGESWVPSFYEPTSSTPSKNPETGNFCVIQPGDFANPGSKAASQHCTCRDLLKDQEGIRKVILFAICDTIVKLAGYEEQIPLGAVPRLGALDGQKKLDLIWEEERYGPETEMEAGTFTDALTGWVVGEEGTILHTPDGGVTWDPQNSGVSSRLYGVFFLEDERGWIVGEEGTILHTTDGGQTWAPQASGTERRLRAVYFTDEQTGWAAGNSRTLLRTTDGGLTWAPQAITSPFGTLYDIEFIDEMNGWIVGDNGILLHTTDGGATWILEPTGTTNALLSIDFLDEKTGWIGGEGGTLLRFTGSDTGTSVEETLAEVPRAFALAQNYPNPFNPETTIEFALPQAGLVRLEVFDVLGRRVETVAVGAFSAGWHRVRWVAQGVPSGVYFYRLESADRAEVKSMLLLR